MGRPDVDAMLEELTPEQIDEWAAYYDIEPWDTRLAAAAICATIHSFSTMIMKTRPNIEGTWNPATDGAQVSDYLMGYRPKRKKKTRPVRPSDFGFM